MRKWLLLLLLSGCVTMPTAEQKHDAMVKPVVLITMSSTGTGSGVVFSSNEEYTLIISANHVTRNEDSLWVEMNGTVYDAEVVKENLELDLSILRIEATTDFVVHIHDEGELQVFDEIFTVAAGRADKPYASIGIISNAHYFRGDMENYIQFSASTVRGGSGGGLFRRHDAHYELVGIIARIALQTVITRILSQMMMNVNLYTIKIPVNNVGFAIRMELVRDFIEEVT